MLWGSSCGAVGQRLGRCGAAIGALWGSDWGAVGQRLGRCGAVIVALWGSDWGAVGQRLGRCGAHLQRLGDARLAGLVDLRLPHAAAARLAQMAQAEAQVLLVRVLLDLRGGP